MRTYMEKNRTDGSHCFEYIVCWQDMNSIVTIREWKSKTFALLADAKMFAKTKQSEANNPVLMPPYIVRRVTWDTTFHRDANITYINYKFMRKLLDKYGYFAEKKLEKVVWKGLKWCF